MMYRRNLLSSVCLIALLPFSAFGQDDGVASLPVFKGPFPDTENMRFLSQIDPEDLGALEVPGVWAKGMMNDIWGWTSPAGEDYALSTNSGGIAFVRVTDPANPEFLGQIQSQLPFDFRNIWGDPATFSHYAYFTTEIDDSAIVIADLSGLDAVGPAPSSDTQIPIPVNFWQEGGYDGSHNIETNEASGFAYVAGVHLEEGAANNACSAEEPARFNTLILDLNVDPMNPTVAACVEDAGEHDFYVINYSGPDPDYLGREIAFVFDGRDRDGIANGTPIGGDTLIWDVTDKNNINEIARFRIDDMVFSHNGWTTDDQAFLFIGDELDELIVANWLPGVFAPAPDSPTNKSRTGTYIVDIRDLDNPVPIERYEDGRIGLDHNFMVKGDELYIASYTTGTRVYSIVPNGDVITLEPLAHMDTEPRLPGNILNVNQENRFGSSFLGQWGVYVFDSGTVIASDINNGLIVMELTDTPCKGIKCSK